MTSEQPASITSTGGRNSLDEFNCSRRRRLERRACRAACRGPALTSGWPALVVAHVVQVAISRGVVPAGRMPLMTAPSEAEIREGKNLLERIMLAEELGDADLRVAYGFPAECLADLADEEEADLIIVGSRGRGAFKTAFLGSVSNGLIGFARCPVLVVPPAAPSAANSRDASARPD